MLTTTQQTDPFHIFLTTLELATRWNMSEHTLRNWRVSGFGPRFIKVCRSVRYRLSVIIAWETANEATSTTKQPKKDSGASSLEAGQ